MTDLRFCGEGGTVVRGDERVSDDPCEYTYGGCNRIRCKHCGAMVKVGLPGGKLKELAQPKPQLYPYDDWFAMPFIERGHPRCRAYACKCSVWQADVEAFLVNDGDSPSDPNVPWTCAGHPVPTLPVTLGPITVANSSDWPSLVRQILDGACPRPLGTRWEGPPTWLRWLYGYLVGLPEADRLSSAVAERISDSDPKVVGAVLGFFERFPNASGAERLIGRAEESIDRILVTVPDPEPDFAPSPQSLWKVMLKYMEYRGEPDPLDARVVALVRKQMLLPASPDVVKEALEKSQKSFDEDDLQWLADHVVEIEKAQPGRWTAVMNLLVYWKRWERDVAHLIAIAGVALVQSGVVSHDEIRKWISTRSYPEDEWVPVIEASLAKSANA